MRILMTSDLHLSHRAICKYRDVFATSAEHDEYVLSEIEKLTKRDILFILGDFLFDSANYDAYMDRLNKTKCRIKLVMGNHDSIKLYKEPRFEMQLPLFTFKNMWVSHCPIHPGELRGRILNIHGHLHKEVIPDKRYFNVNLDANDYKFVEIEAIRERASSIQQNNDKTVYN